MSVRSLDPPGGLLAKFAIGACVVATFRFVPSARLQRFLGKELIADPNVAVAEFVKNAYDAGATNVYVELSLSEARRANHQLIIADNGGGMDEESFEKNWMHPGFSEKASDELGSTANRRWRRSATACAAKRVPIGEKGVGRLAAGRLGERVDVYTRVTREEPWLHVAFNWRLFDTMTSSMDQIPIPYDFSTDPPPGYPTIGTLIQISDLSLDWRGRLPGRKISGRSDSRLGRLKEDLSVLIQPLGQELGDFQVSLTANPEPAPNFNGNIRAGEPEWDAYRYDFSVERESNGAVRVQRTIRRSPDVADRVGQAELQELGWTVLTQKSKAGFEDDYRPQDLSCGPFQGHLLYTTLPWKRLPGATVPPGVLLYRDGIRVPPYGDDDDDWLNARSRKASRQGYALQPASLWGAIAITKSQNPNLTDMSNRDGLVANDEYEDFLRHARAEYREFAELVEREYIAEGWDKKRTNRAADDAETRRREQQALAHMYVHSLRGPVSAARIDIQNAAALIGTTDKLERVQMYLSRADSNLGTVSDRLEDLLRDAGEDLPDAEEFDLRDAVSAGIEQAHGTSTSRDVSVYRELGRQRIVVLPRRIVTEAVSTVVVNGAEVRRPTDRLPGSITVTISDAGIGYRIAIRDDGVGMNDSVRSALFSEARTEKGHPGLGLTYSRTLLRMFGADVTLGQTGSGGSTFNIELPSVGYQRRRSAS